MQLSQPSKKTQICQIDDTNPEPAAESEPEAGGAAGEATLTLTQLNDDCLLLICLQLSIRDQLMLLELDGRLQQLVLQIWQRKYASEFDWQRNETQLKWLSALQRRQLLRHIAALTRALLNLSASDELSSWSTGTEQLLQLQRLSFTDCSVAVLRQLPQTCCNLVQLQLGRCDVDITPKDLSTLFTQLSQLRVFELLPRSKSRRGSNSSSSRGSNCAGTIEHWMDIEYGQTLEIVAMPACGLRASAAKIARLPQLRLLRGLLCCSNSSGASSNSNSNGDSDSDIEEDKVKPNGGDGDGDGDGGATATATISACLKALSDDVACQIVALNMQCQLDGSMLRLLQGYLNVVLQLERFAWRSQLMVHYDAVDGSIKWLPQQPQVSRAILHFIVSQAASLHELDLMHNVHAMPPFVAELTEHLLLSAAQLGNSFHPTIWHDACPKPPNSANEPAYAAGIRNDLAFVELQLKRN